MAKKEEKAGEVGVERRRRKELEETSLAAERKKSTMVRERRKARINHQRK